MTGHDVQHVVLGSLRDIDADPQAVLGSEEETPADAAGDDSALVLKNRHIAPGGGNA